MRTAFAVLLAGVCLAEEAVTLEWRLEPDTVFALDIHSKRSSSMTTARGNLTTSFDLHITAKLSIARVSNAGAEGTMVIESVKGSLSAMGLSTDVAYDTTTLPDVKVPFTLTRRGVLSFDEEILKSASPKTDVAEDFAFLFPVLPDGKPLVGASWTEEVERHTDEIKLDDVKGPDERRVAVLSGTSKADTKGDTGEGGLKTVLKVDGTWQGSFDLTAGHLSWSEQSLTEESMLESKDSKLETKGTIQRKVGVAREPAKK